MTKIVVIGGTGLTGSKLGARLAEHGHKAIAASRSSGVNTLTGVGLVGTERLSESGYPRAKLVQEKLIKESGIPYSIVHATQFFEFVKRIADSATEGNTVRLSHALIQPSRSPDQSSSVSMS
jgi:uncharacterized protein YbjT (DUF2867 family)